MDACMKHYLNIKLSPLLFEKYPSKECNYLHLKCFQSPLGCLYYLKAQLSHGANKIHMFTDSFSYSRSSVLGRRASYGLAVCLWHCLKEATQVQSYPWDWY